MRKINLISILVFVLNFSLAAQTTNPLYNKALADSLGADENGMKAYTFVMLRTGTAKIEDKAKLSKLFEGHMANINKMVDEGKLIVAGPFGKNDKTYRGIFIFQNATIDEIKIMLQNDPTIVEKVFEADIVPWYGSAALPLYLETAKRIEK